MASPDTELCGWVDIDASRVRSAADAEGLDELATGGSLERMLAEQRPDFLVNVTPPTAHHDLTIAALEQGLDVLSEKPLAASLPEAHAMIAAAERAGRLFMVSQNRRYMPELVAFRDTVAQLGRLSTLTCEFHIAHRVPDSRFLNSFPQPLLLDMAIHLFDGARAISGADPLSVYCDSYNPPWSWYDGPAAAHAVFRMSDELRFAFTGNWAADGFRTSWTGTWRAVGERGSATWEGDGAAPRAEADGVTRVRPAHGAARPGAVRRSRGRARRLRGRRPHRQRARRRVPRQRPQPRDVPRGGRVSRARGAGSHPLTAAGHGACAPVAR